MITFGGKLLFYFLNLISFIYFLFTAAVYTFIVFHTIYTNILTLLTLLTLLTILVPVPTIFAIYYLQHLCSEEHNLQYNRTYLHYNYYEHYKYYRYFAWDSVTCSFHRKKFYSKINFSKFCQDFNLMLYTFWFPKVWSFVGPVPTLGVLPFFGLQLKLSEPVDCLHPL